MSAKKSFFFVAAFLCLHSVWSQQLVDNICMQVIGSNGLSAEKLGKHYDATLGEVMTATLTSVDGTTILTQGFHQPECGLAMVSTNDPLASLHLSVYPIPTASTLHIQYEHPDGITLNTRIWSINGALIADWAPTPVFSEIDCRAYAPGFYLLQIKDPKSGHITTIRFVKTSI